MTSMIAYPSDFALILSNPSHNYGTLEKRAKSGREKKNKTKQGPVTFLVAKFTGGRYSHIRSHFMSRV